MKKIIKTLVIAFSFLPILAMAVTETKPYQLLTKVGGETAVKSGDLGTYLIQIYWYVMYLAVGLAVLMLVIGGLEYTLTWTKEVSKEKAKNRIQMALIGLLLALGSYLILNEINPNLLSLEIGGKSTIKSGGASQ